MTLLGPMGEREWQAEVTRAATTFGWWSYHTHDSRRSPAGLPDLLLVHTARRIVAFRELKTDKGRLTDTQRLIIETLTLAGADVAVWRPRDADAVWTFLAGRPTRWR